MTNCKFGIIHLLPSQMGNFLEAKGVFHVLEGQSFPFIEEYMAAQITLGLVWSVVNGIDGMLYT